MLDSVPEHNSSRKGGASVQNTLTTASPSSNSSSAIPIQSPFSRNPYNLPRDHQSTRADPLTGLSSPKRLTAETMLTHLQTIQNEEQKRLSKRRESSTAAVDTATTSSALHLPPPSPITSAPASQSPTRSRPHDGDDNDDDDDDHNHNDRTPNPYASCTPHQLSIATSRLHDIAQQFQDVVAGLQDAITRQQASSATTTPARPELLSLQERLARVHSVAITEHEIVVREVKARRGGGGGERRTEEASKRSGGYY